MTEGDFGLIVDLLCGAYPGKIFTEDNQIQTYYDFLKNYDPSAIYITSKLWISENKYPPTIAEWLSCLKENKYREVEET